MFSAGSGTADIPAQRACAEFTAASSGERCVGPLSGLRTAVCSVRATARTFAAAFAAARLGSSRAPAEEQADAEWYARSLRS